MCPVWRCQNGNARQDDYKKRITAYSLSKAILILNLVVFRFPQTTVNIS